MPEYTVKDHAICELAELVRDMHKEATAMRRPDWSTIYADSSSGPDDSRLDLLVVTRETLRLSLSALKQDAAEDYYHNVGAAIREISTVLYSSDEREEGEQP